MIASSGGKKRPVWRARHRVDRAGMAREWLTDRGTGARVPEPHSAVTACGGEEESVVAESFIDASEGYIDGIWKNGDLQWSSMSRNHMSPLSAVQGGVLAAHILSRKRHSSLFQQAETLARQALTSLDASDCVFHLEAFTEDSGLTFGECASVSRGRSPLRSIS
ncbi:hypothetical protein [Streptomyces antimycoticus]|uniref:hypothetical protein n=1 Tax=Streptomyces antimycoticus TaxID=68175 RepID=UPI003822F6AE